MRLMQLLSAFKTQILDFLLPESCMSCGKEEILFCTPCRLTLTAIPPCCFGCGKTTPLQKRTPSGRTCRYCRHHSPIYRFLSPYRYDNEVVRNLIHALKYQRIRKLAQVIANLLFHYFVTYRISLPAQSVLLPLPLHPGRKRQRGFNQSELIAQSLTEKIGVPLETKVLVRVKKTSPQIELSGEARRENVKGVFAVTRAEKIKRKTVLLLDDVKTTGATIEEAAKVLRKAGARRITAITFAH